MPVDVTEMIACLEGKLQFEVDNRKDKVLRLTVEDRLVAWTKVSHGRGFDIGDSLLSKMARQIHLSTSQLKKAISCELSREQYMEKLRVGGFL